MHFDTTEPLGALARRALGFVKDDTTVGLGAGRAATAFVRALAARVRDGLRVRGVPVSLATAELAAELGIPLVGLDADIDVTVDGADEVDPELNLIKGYGGALVRERIVAAASRRQVILVQEDKLVPRLGSRGRLPVEVLTFALPFARRRFAALGFASELRMAGGWAFVSDNGNAIVDLVVGPIADPPGLERALRAVPGVVDTGLFLGTAETVLVADGTSVSERSRQR